VNLAHTSSRSEEELIRACAESGSAEDWEEFVQRFHGMIAAVVIRTTSRWGASSPALVDDLVQETYLKICGDRKRLLSEFRPQHSEAFYGYLKVVTVNIVHDYFRAQRTQKRGSSQTESYGEDETSLASHKNIKPTEDAHRSILLREVDRALCSVASSEDMKRDRTIFFLYYRYGLTASAIARLPSIALTVKGVESVIHRLTQQVRERLSERDRASSGDQESKGVRSDITL
jgi:RNA polymerase sigma-70 factor, ECF subfamily